MQPALDRRRIFMFLAFAFGIAWAAALVIFLTGGLINSPRLGANLTLAGALLPTVYMFAPALANWFTRRITGEGGAFTGLTPRLRQNWSFWLLAWVGPGVLTVLGAAIFFTLFPAYFDPTLGPLQFILPAGVSSAWAFAGIQTLLAVLISPLVNGLFTFGEEFGWRAYLLQKLMPLGPRRAMLWMGLIWGVWHWPLIAMGYNYGPEYPGSPWLGMLAMVWFCFGAGTFLGWLALKTESVWPAVIGHAAINGIAAIGMVAVIGSPATVLGPTPVGVIGSLGFSLAALAVLLSPKALPSPTPPESAPI